MMSAVPGAVAAQGSATEAQPQPPPREQPGPRSCRDPHTSSRRCTRLRRSPTAAPSLEEDRAVTPVDTVAASVSAAATLTDSVAASLVATAALERATVVSAVTAAGGDWH
ncbi:hypothetical protein V5799_013274 [Amblyomma americanum]|uniref:Uncharacterized protein n=1 Tax=Amblyomma americanum TaxID=6943 RepID=A0AAQ4E6F0_AMBAM